LHGEPGGDGAVGMLGLYGISAAYRHQIALCTRVTNTNTNTNKNKNNNPAPDGQLLFTQTLEHF
jgi:hypothetical protein